MTPLVTPLITVSAETLMWIKYELIIALIMLYPKLISSAQTVSHISATGRDTMPC